MCPVDDKNMTCRTGHEMVCEHRKNLPDVIHSILEQMDDESCFAHIGDDPIHFSTSVRDMIDKFREVIFPGYFSREKLDGVNLKYTMGQTISMLHEILASQITHVLRHDCLRYGQECSECETSGYRTAIEVLKAIPDLRRMLSEDVRGAFDGDPAAKSHDEIIFSYPGIYAITVYRIAHILHAMKVPQLPRIMSEHAHSVTGIDIHPGAAIGKRFVIDHGTGIVIGETSVIGDNVRMYQNVTIGALSLPQGAGEKLRGEKRHPTIEDDVIIYSGATILGGSTVIGKGSIIGGNVWLTRSVPRDTKVFIEVPRLIYSMSETA
ncbi:MAG: serine acetyltransferase [Desulfamplus sp.]|nr:serine acetyltransferase [Desulfamplus sp.]